MDCKEGLAACYGLCRKVRLLGWSGTDGIALTLFASAVTACVLIDPLVESWSLQTVQTVTGSTAMAVLLPLMTETSDLIVALVLVLFRL